MPQSRSCLGRVHQLQYWSRAPQPGFSSTFLIHFQLFWVLSIPRIGAHWGSPRQCIRVFEGKQLSVVPASPRPPTWQRTFRCSEIFAEIGDCSIGQSLPWQQMQKCRPQLVFTVAHRYCIPTVHLQNIETLQLPDIFYVWKFDLHREGFWRCKHWLEVITSPNKDCN